jgi:hypothetical protein
MKDVRRRADPIVCVGSLRSAPWIVKPRNECCRLAGAQFLQLRGERGA